MSTIDEETPLLISDESHTPSSTFKQTTINSLNLLMGMGLLSLPFAFAKLGWLLAITLLSVFCLMALFTACLIAKCMAADSKPTSMLDIADLAFGKSGRLFVGTIYTLELFTASVAMLILFADSIASLFPQLTKYKPVIVGLAVLLLTPVTWQRSLSKISFLSILGVLSLFIFILTLLFDGLTYDQSPGSILVPAQTNLWPSEFNDVGLGIGLLFVGLDGIG